MIERGHGDDHRIDENNTPSTTHNLMTGEADAAVQAGTVGSVHLGDQHDRRGVFALAIVAVLLIVAVVVVAVFDDKDRGPAPASPVMAPEGQDIRIQATKVFLDDDGRSMAIKAGFVPSPTLEAMLAQPRGAVAETVQQAIDAAGGVRVRNVTVRMTLEGRRAEQIRVVGITPEIVSRERPLSGTFFFRPPQGGDPIIKMLVDLDRDPPVPREVTLSANVEQIGKPYFESNTISLKQAEQQVVLVRVRSVQSYVKFRLKITYQVDGETRSTTVDDAGAPFEVSGPSAASDANKLSYEHVFSLNGRDFSMCRVARPEAFEYTHRCRLSPMCRRASST